MSYHQKPSQGDRNDPAESIITEEEIAVTRDKLRKLPRLTIGQLVLASRYVLAPLAGYTNLAFRRIVRELGGLGLATTDLVNARGLLSQNTKSLKLIETCQQDRPYAVQLFGADPMSLRDAAQWLEARGEVSAIDLNLGCPVPKVTKQGAGAGLLCNTAKAVELVRTVVEAVSLPVTVKMRLGWDDTHWSAPELAREFEAIGVAAITIHGRTRAQGFSGKVNLQGIRAVVEAVSKIPILGNGDVCDLISGVRMLRDTGCHGLSIGRGALANPWIFRQFSHWETYGSWPPPGNAQERLILMRRQLDYLAELHTMHRAIPMFRKMAHWYLKSLGIPAELRNELQQASTLKTWEEAMERVRFYLLERGIESGTWSPHAIAVPQGPVSHW